MISTRYFGLFCLFLRFFFLLRLILTGHRNAMLLLLERWFYFENSAQLTVFPRFLFPSVPLRSVHDLLCDVTYHLFSSLFRTSFLPLACSRTSCKHLVLNLPRCGEYCYFLGNADMRFSSFPGTVSRHSFFRPLAAMPDEARNFLAELSKI